MSVDNENSHLIKKNSRDNFNTVLSDEQFHNNKYIKF